MVLCQCPRAKKQLSRSKANALIPAVTGGRSRKKYSRITTPTSLFIFNTSDTMVKVCFHLISPQRWQLLLQGEVKGCFQASGSVSSRPVPHADYHVLCQAQPGSRVQLSRQLWGTSATRWILAWLQFSARCREKGCLVHPRANSVHNA